jgi:hypothetical protein
MTGDNLWSLSYIEGGLVMYFSDPPMKANIHVNLTFKDGKWVTEDGSPFPMVNEGAFGVLVFDRLELIDPKDRARYSQEMRMPFLPKDTYVYARINAKNLDSALRDHVVLREVEGPTPRDFFVPFLLVQDLELRVRFGKPALLEPCECRIPSLGLDARSVNEAYTLISTSFEPTRRSHTGNVFNCVYFDGPLVLQRLDRHRAMIVGSAKFDLEETDAVDKPGQRAL